MNWISVDSKLPDMHEPYKNATYLASKDVLVWTGHYCQIAKYEETYKKRIPRWVQAGTGRVIYVSHWAEVPEGPKEEVK